MGAIANAIGYYAIGLPIGISLMFAAKMGVLGTCVLRLALYELPALLLRGQALCLEQRLSPGICAQISLCIHGAGLHTEVLR